MKIKPIASLPLWCSILLAVMFVTICVLSGWLIYTKNKLNATTTNHPPLVVKGESRQSTETAESTEKQSEKTPSLVIPELLTRDPWGLTSPFDAGTWDPFTEMQRLREEMDRTFSEAFERFGQSSQFGNLTDPHFPLRPRIDVSETDEHYRVIVDLPGIDEAQIETELEGQRLTIRTKHEEVQQQENDQGKMLRQERRVGSFQRTLTFEQPVKVEGMESDYENGVLTLIVPKA